MKGYINKAVEHTQYIENKMKEKGTKDIDFVNKTSREMVEKMNEKRKPLYYIEGKKEETERKMRNWRSIRKGFEVFIERNYTSQMEKIIERKRRWKEGDELSGFVPRIDENSKTMMEIREKNEPGEIYKNLFNDAKFMKEKRDKMIEERNRKMLQDELKETTFQPQIVSRREFIGTYVDPK